MNCGADFVMTQPIFDPSLFSLLKEATNHLNIPIFVGINPLINYKSALFLHNEVPGYRLPQTIMRRMSKYEGDDALKEGMEIAMELIIEAMKYFNGLFLVTPFVRYELSAQLIEFVKSQQK